MNQGQIGEKKSALQIPESKETEQERIQKFKDEYRR